jgi:predicted nucleotidyltransferase
MTEMLEYIEAYRRRAQEQQKVIARRAEKAYEIALSCARRLVEEFGADRVLLIGSLAEGYFRATSDIDLVVQGLSPRLFFRASAQIARAAGDFEVDLIPWETYKYKTEVLEKGRLLYESRRSKSAESVGCLHPKRDEKTTRVDG